MMSDSEIQERIDSFIDQYPLCEYLLLKTADLTLTPEVKVLCEQDAAVYGERRNVPPVPSSFEKCRAEIEQYQNAFLFDAVYEVADAYDLERCTEARKDHAAMVRDLCGEFRSRFGDVMALSISCDLCDDCPCPKKPCKRPEQKIVSMDSYGVQIMKTLADRDIMYDYGINTAIYFTLILFNAEKD